VKTIVLLLPVLLLAGCSDGRGEPARPAGDTLSRAQRDSIIGASRLPGARAVQRALDVSDTAAARALRIDSIPD